jgi:superfamily II DNA or RNA helicase
MALQIIAEKRQKTLWLTHTKDLALQTADRCETFLGFKPGMIDADNYDTSPPLVIGMVQSLGGRLDDHFVKMFGCTCLDECHHQPAASFRSLVTQFWAKHRLGLTATPFRRDQLEPILFAVLGPIQAEVSSNELTSNGEILAPEIRVVHTNSYKGVCDSYHDLLNVVTSDRDRTNLIVDLVIEEAKTRPTLVLSERIAHVKILYEVFRHRSTIPAVYITGRQSKKTRKEALSLLDQGKVQVAFASQIANEGLDVQRLSALFLSCPIRSSSKIQQQIGRIQRTFNGKRDCVVYDFVDDHISLAKSQFYSRLNKVYQSQEWKVEHVYPYGEDHGDPDHQEAV